MSKKMKKLVLVVTMLTVMVAGALPQAAFAQQVGAPEGIQPEPGDEGEPGVAAESGAEPGAEAQPGAEAELGGNDQSAIGGTDLSDQSIAESGAEAQPGCEEANPAAEAEQPEAEKPEEPTADAEPADEANPGCEAEPTNGNQGILGGHHAGGNEYPFVVPLLYKSSGGLFCGGSLIDQDSVLTAAHCVVDNPVSASALQVAVGRSVLSSDEGLLRNVERIDVHPKYNPSTNKYDVAVLKLERPVPDPRSRDYYERALYEYYLSLYKPIRVAGPEDGSLEKPGTSLTVAGWGDTLAGPGTSEPDRMQQVKVSVISDNEATKRLSKASGYLKSFDGSLMIPAGGRKDQGHCNGDSGGPLFAYNGSEYVQVGVVSGAIKCDDPDYPGIYAEVNAPSIKAFITDAASE